MKQVLIVAVVVLVAGVLVWFLHARPGTEIVFTWSNSANALAAHCSATVTKDCIAGLTLTDETAGKVISSTISPAAQSYTYRPGGPIPAGYRHIFTLATNAIRQDGTPITSAPAQIIVEHPFWKFEHPRGMAMVR